MRRAARIMAWPCVRTARILYRFSDILAVTLRTYARNDIGASSFYEREMRKYISIGPTMLTYTQLR